MTAAGSADRARLDLQAPRALGNEDSERLLAQVDLELVLASVEPTPTGPTLRIDGRYLHSSRDPAREVQRRIAGLPAARREDLLVFFGDGLGATVSATLHESENDVVWIEPDARIALAALATTEFGEHLGRRLTLVLEEPDEDRLQDLFRGRSNQSVHFVEHPASFRLSPAYGERRDRIQTFLNRKDVNMATMARFDRAWTANLCANFAELADCRPVARLFGSCTGRLGLVVGAGPSLADSLEEIAELRQGNVLIAVDTAVRPLGLAGIDPDIIVSVDPQAINREHLEGYQGRSLFVIDPTVNYLALRHLPADRTFFTDSPFALAVLFFQHLGEQAGTIAFGGSVSTNAYDLAFQLGCSTVVLYGQDLSFTGGQAHVKGAMLEERLNFRESRTFRRELHNYRQLTALPVRQISAIGGGTVPTNDKLQIFAGWLQRRIARDQLEGARIYNRTPVGADLGAQGGDLPGGEGRGGAELKAVLETAGGPAIHFERSAFRDTLHATLNSLAELLAITTVGLETAERVARIATSGNLSMDYRNGLQELDRLDSQLRERMEAAELVGGLMQRTILQITEGFDPGEAAPDNADQAVAERTLALYRGLDEAGRRLARHLRRATWLIR